jgi:hypothetical protein
MSGPVRHMIGYPGDFRTDASYEEAFKRANDWAFKTQKPIVVYEVRELVTVDPLPLLDFPPPKRHA